MMHQKFRTYGLAVELYRECQSLEVRASLKDQLLRAASSIALNLAEGSAKPTPKEKKRFYAIAFGSLRETQSILDLIGLDRKTNALQLKADHIGACLYKLVYQ